MKKFLMLYLDLAKYIGTHLYVVLLALPFFIMGIACQILASSYFVDLFQPSIILFSAAWTLLIVCTSVLMKNKIGKTIYWLAFLVQWLMMITHFVYHHATGFCFNFNLMHLAGEGMEFSRDAILSTAWYVWVLAVFILLLAAFASQKIPKNEKTKWKKQAIVVVSFVILRILAIFSLGSLPAQLDWSNFANKRLIYENFNNTNRCIQICGSMEFTTRSFLKSIFGQTIITEEEKQELDALYDSQNGETTNAYTGIFSGRNVIILQLEGMDTWLWSDETTPNLCELRKHSIDFTQHYSMNVGGGSTFNSEFAVNTGFVAPLSYMESPTQMDKNTFDQTLPKLLRANGYHVNAFHANNADFYSRDTNYANWGYERFYSLCDLRNYTDWSYALDRELIKNETFRENLFPHDGPFLDYIITLSSHMPFDVSDYHGKLIATMKYGEDIPKMTEEECAKMMAGETDYMVGLLMQALRDEGLYENTVIVAFADHYLYTLKDKTILDKYKQTDNNLINHTPFFIWSSDIEPTTITEVTMQTNILPTVLNLLGIPYQPANYLCEDALAEDYEGFAFFPDASWYDGSAYVENGQITNGGSCDDLDRKNQKILDIIRKNDLTLKTDYFRTRKEIE